MADLSTIANDAISELKRVKGYSLRFSEPLYFAIKENDEIQSSNLWLILKNALRAIIVLPYTYTVISADDTSAFILFIDEKGNCNDSITVNGWNLKFDTPLESSYRTSNRSAIISKKGHELTLETRRGYITSDEFMRIWKYFKLISRIDEDYSCLPLFKELYNNEISIETLNRENIRKEYERYKTEALLNANKELLDNIRQIVNTK